MELIEFLEEGGQLAEKGLEALELGFGQDDITVRAPRPDVEFQIENVADRG